MLHTMRECLKKIQAIGQIAKNGREMAEDEITRIHFEQILQEVGYLEREAEDES